MSNWLFNPLTEVTYHYITGRKFPVTTTIIVFVFRIDIYPNQNLFSDLYEFVNFAFYLHFCLQIKRNATFSICMISIDLIFFYLYIFVWIPFTFYYTDIPCCMRERFNVKLLNERDIVMKCHELVLFSYVLFSSDQFCSDISTCRWNKTRLLLPLPADGINLKRLRNWQNILPLLLGNGQTLWKLM